MDKYIIPLIKRNDNPTTGETISAGYPLGQHWFNESSGDEYLHISDGVWVDSIPASLLQVTNWFTGFERNYNGVTTPDSTISFDTSTKIFTIAPVSTSFNVYSRGTKFIKTTETIDLTSIWSNNTLFFIYFSETGVLSAGTSPWDISGSGIPIATLLWNGTSSFSILADERHSVKRNNVTHKNLHVTRGAQISSADTDFSISTMTSTSTIIQSGTLIDEDLELPISTQTDSLRIVYRTGTTLTYSDNLSATSAHIVSGVLQYDNAGTLTPVTDGYFIRNTIIVSNSSSAPIVCRVAQSQFLNINDARNSEPPTAVSYLSNETRQIYSVIWKNVGGTPTFVEYADFRKAPTLPNGFIAKTPRYLDGLEDVYVPTPNIDDVIKWNGNNWVNGIGVTSSAGNGVEFYPDDTAITPASTNSVYPIKTLSKTPVTTTEDVDTITLTTANVVYMYGNYLYNTPIGRTVLDAGIWGFDVYCGVDSSTGVSTLRQNLYRVRGSLVTLTTTGAGTSRTVNAVGATDFATTKIDVSAVLDVTSFIQTPQGFYPITARASDTQVTITVPTTYVNETNVAFSVHKKLFGVTTPELNNVSGTAPAWNGLALYTINSVQSSFIVEENDKLSTSFFGTSTSNNRSIQFAHNGTARYSHIHSPLITLHNNLSGVQDLSNNIARHINNDTQTFSGVKTFNSSPIAPTPTANDNSTKVATTAYIDNALLGINTILDSINGQVI
jgi:hypothetical protein